jgi:AcrR family transcriptional regulator
MSRQTGEQRRQQLLEAAIALFSIHGFEGTTTRAIAEAMGVTEALIFHYFPTKLALFHAVIAEYGMQSLHPIPLDGLDAKPLSELLTIQLNLFLSTMWKNRVAIRMLIGAAFNDSVALTDIKVLDARPRERLKLLLTRYETEGMITPGMAAPAAAVISAAVGGFFFASMRDEPEDWENARTTFVNRLITVVMPGLQP